ncbi:MAG: major facilitator superfamily 1 [Clostridia bacterium]|jgi:MFS family permease|nr:major facilitator superfamily 1 [Clostridia bacterium]
MSKKKSFNMNFSLFLMGRLISDAGTGVQTMIIPLYVLDIGGSAAMVGILSFLSLLPSLIVSPFAGVLGDRVNRKTIMVVTDFVSGTVVLALALLAYAGRMNIGLLMAVQIIISLMNGLFDPATRGMMTELASEDKLGETNSIVTAIKSLSFMLGPIIGTLIYGKYGITTVFLVNGVSFLLSAICEMMIRYTYIKHKLVGGISGVTEDIIEGFKFIMDNEIIRRLCYFFLAIYFVVQPLIKVVLPLLFKTQLSYSDTQYGYLQAIVILGVFIGSIMVGSVFGKEKNNIRPLKIGCILLVVSMFMFSSILFPNILYKLGNGSVSYFILLAGVLCLLSASIMIITIPVQTYIQRETPNGYMSRVLSMVSLISRGGTPFGALIYGIVLNSVAIHLTLLVAAIFMAFLTAAFLRSAVRTMKFL